MILVVISYHIVTIKLIIKESILFLDEHLCMNSHYMFNITKIVYFYIDKVVIGATIICFISWTTECTIKVFCEKCIMDKMAKGALEKSLVDYLYYDKNIRSFMITGQWGVGKTYCINEFIKKYSPISARKYYKISCYGLDDREKIAKEISKVFESSDNSFARRIVDILGCIPVAGDIINNLFSVKYDYKLTKRESIFVFDDFERIVGENISEKNRLSITNNEGHYRRLVGRSGVEDRLEEIDKHINEISTTIAYSIKYDICMKYASVLGFINELMEVYGAKVIIVCDTNKLGVEIKRDIICNKLNSRVFSLKLTDKRREEIVDNIVAELPKRYINMPKSIRLFIEKYKKQFKMISYATVFGNLRNFATIFDAFVSTSMVLDDEKLSDDFLLSLVNSITIVHYTYYAESYNEDLFDNFEVGSNIYYLLKKTGNWKWEKVPFARDKEKFGLYESDIKWVGNYLASRWLFSVYEMHFNCSKLIKEWLEYEYSEIECLLYKNPTSKFEQKKCRLDHVFFCTGNLEIEEFDGENYYRLLLLTVDTNNVSDFNDVEGILEKYAYAMKNSNAERDRVFVEFLIATYVNGESRGNKEINEVYNEKLKERMNV